MWRWDAMTDIPLPSIGRRTPVYHLMRIRLTRKLAESLDGVDLSSYGPGEVIDLPQRDAALVIAERWAVPLRSAERSSFAAKAATHAGRLRSLQNSVHGDRVVRWTPRRFEDDVRDQLHDSRAVTITKSHRMSDQRN
jgi:hypothetical protein